MPSPDPDASAFRVRVGGFDGPFDLLLDLIGRRELDVTELALAVVTDEFLAHLERLGDDADLDQTSGFLVVGATLLDAKIAGLLPAGEVVDAEAVAMLEARDLLFARLLQYRAFKEATTWFADALAIEEARHAHRGAVHEAQLPPLPPPELPVDVAAFALLAAAALAPRPEPSVRVDHLHGSAVGLREQAAAVVSLLRRGSAMSFLDLAGPEAERPIVVARFLAVLELHRLGAIAFEQLDPLGALVVRWTAPDWDDSMLARLGGGFDE
ncbi:segregation and condensation protein A [Amnibacterium setariae]|uniref:Segregation and condensation protein A n=1 Tax=Amnibacterium setariae TaxID=2306585 RepID=A0A3A1TXX1_9MICO|nr:ScpA family protein [Amnibacterium setariae]RIX27515.1 segregation/condensation protein A [Amnibacterium setariae]